MNRPGPAAGTDRDDDRFWKAGLVYVNRGDPAVMVSARFGLGWTLNLGNPAAWLLIGAILASGAGLAVLRIAAGMQASLLSGAAAVEPPETGSGQAEGEAKEDPGLDPLQGPVAAGGLVADGFPVALAI